MTKLLISEIQYFLDQGFTLDQVFEWESKQEDSIKQQLEFRQDTLTQETRYEPSHQE